MRLLDFAKQHDINSHEALLLCHQIGPCAIPVPAVGRRMHTRAAGGFPIPPAASFTFRQPPLLEQQTWITDRANAGLLIHPANRGGLFTGYVAQRSEQRYLGPLHCKGGASVGCRFESCHTPSHIH